MSGEPDLGPKGEKAALVLSWGIVALALYGAVSALGYLGGWVV